MTKKTANRALTNAKLCSACKGECCKTYPGISTPEDWCSPVDEAVLQKKLTEALKSGLWTIDWWEGDPRVDTVGMNEEERDAHYNDPNRIAPGYFIRPAMKNAVGKLKHAPWGGGECALLGETGCSLPFKKRPIECRLLIPLGHPNCTYADGQDGTVVGKRALAVKWIPYHKVIQAAYEAAGGDRDTL